MSRGALRAGAATAIVTLAAATGASAAPAPKKLTHQYPLGTETLSHSASTPKRSGPPPAHTKTKPPTAPPSATGTRQHRSHGLSQGKRIALLVLAGAIVGAVLIADWIVLRRRRRPTPPRRGAPPPPRAPPQGDRRTRRRAPSGLHRAGPRPRRRVPRLLLLLLGPVYRYDRVRDAWILRLIGRRHGPVLRPDGYEADRFLGDPADDEPDISALHLIDTRHGDSRDSDEPPPLRVRRRQG